jgi:hypothetical protein
MIFAVSVSLPVAQSVARGIHDRSAPEAIRALSRQGYVRTVLRCSRRQRALACGWTGVRNGEDCSGTLAVSPASRHRLIVRITHPRCRARRVATPDHHTQFGFNVFSSPWTVAQQRSLGATVRRIDVPWKDVEPAPGQWDWHLIDQQYSEVLAAGLRPEMFTDSAPCWARPSMACNDGLYTGPPDPTYDPYWSDYVRQLTARYPAAIGIEIWNEPNLITQWWPRVDPVRYTQLLKEAFAAVKSVDPNMPVVSGGLLSSPASASWIEGDVPFLTAMFAAGAQKSMDAIGVHPYPVVYGSGGAVGWDPAQMVRWLRRIRAVRDAAGATSEPIWVTEVGESTTTQPGQPPAVTDAQQAADLVQMVRAAESARDVPVLIIHTLDRAPPNLADDLLINLLGPVLNYNGYGEEVNAGFGVFNPDGSPAPAACALSREFQGSLGC